MDRQIPVPWLSSSRVAWVPACARKATDGQLGRSAAWFSGRRSAKGRERPQPLGRRRRGGWHGVATVIVSEYGAAVPGWLILPVSGSRQRVRDSRRGHCRKKWSIYDSHCHVLL